ncbi:MAG: hypothetical protein NZM39_11535 [Bernardetiaceae bacterium]|nr:hypothetical protein [Bernardetiaceae bacterium]
MRKKLTLEKLKKLPSMHPLPRSVLYANYQPKVIFTQPYTQILYYPEFQIIYYELVGKFTHQQYQTIYNTLLDALKAYFPKGLIASQLRSEGSSIQDRAWLISSWLPKLKTVMPKEFIIVGLREEEEKSAFKRWIAEYLEKAVKSVVPYTVKALPDFDTAVSFINQCTKVNLQVLQKQ